MNFHTSSDNSTQELDDDSVDCPSTHNPSDLEDTSNNAVIFPTNKDQLDNCIRSFKLAEQCIKAAEFSDGNLDHPAVNELRYYGYHLNKALCAVDERDQYEELKRAERHCGRAQYDAAELSLISYLENIAEFIDDYRKVQVTKVVQDYPSLLTKAHAIQDFLSANSNHERHEYFEECKEHVETLKVISRTLGHARNDLNQVTGMTAREKCSWVITVISVLVTLIVLLYTTFVEDKVTKVEINSTYSQFSKVPQSLESQKK